MSAQNSPRGGVFSALAGLIGFSALAGLLVTVMVTPALAVTGITASSTIGIFDSLPEYLEIGRQPERNTIYATSSGEGNVNGYIPIATIYDQNRQEIPLDQISQYAIDAAIDGEDERFFDHGGVDVQSVIRAAVGNIGAGSIESGSSTLTMQLVKNIYVQKALEEPTEAERDAKFAEATAPDFDRKLKEMKLAIGLEKRYTKNEILNAYLNIAFFGDNTYGIQAAAQRYYSVNAKDLTLAQAASLIAIVQYPGERGLDVPENYERNQARRDVILDSMLRLGDITQAEHDEAIAITVSDETLLPQPPQSGCIGANQYAKWWCDYIVNNIENYPQLGATPEERAANWKIGGYELYTTLDMDVQPSAQQEIWNWVPNNDPWGISLGAASVSIEPGSGRIVTMSENKEFNNTQEGGGPNTSAVNFNTGLKDGGGSGFQSGSTYKLFTLLEWLDTGHGLADRVNGAGRTEQQGKFKDTCMYAKPNPGPWGGPYKFQNDSGGGGVTDVYSATTASVNGAFISMALQLDLCGIRDMAAALGVERGDGDQLFTNPSSVLGTNEVTPLSMANAYATIAANGLYCKPVSLDKVIGPDGTDLGGQAPDCHQAIRPELAATAAYALQGVMNGGTGGASNPGDGVPIIGKTGTTDDGWQTWIITSTTEVATAVWVGNWIGEVSMSDWSWNGVGGRVIRHEIMRNTMAVINGKYHGVDFPAPDPTLSGGSAGIPIPDFAGQSPDSAKTVLEGLGFTVADGGQVDSAQPAGRIASTDPPAGSPGAIGQTVTLYISKGNQIQIPDAVSGANNYNDSKAILQGSGFNNVSQGCTVVANPTDVGKPRSQSPGAGAYATPNTPIRVNIGALSC